MYCSHMKQSVTTAAELFVTKLTAIFSELQMDSFYVDLDPGVKAVAVRTLH